MINITDITDMSDEQLRELLTRAAEEMRTLEAERDSYKEENEELKGTYITVSEELQKTKKLNFTLARSLDTSNSASVEDTLHSMFN